MLVNGRIGPCFKAKFKDVGIVSEAKIKTEYQHIRSLCLSHSRRIQKQSVLLSNDVSQHKVAEIMAVSQLFKQRNNRRNDHPCR